MFKMFQMKIIKNQEIVYSRFVSAIFYQSFIFNRMVALQKL